MSVIVAVPVRLARFRIWVDKSRRWNAVDRMLLWSICEKPRTPSELALEANVPARLINQIIIRLLQVGWVELTATEAGVVFQATTAGGEALTRFDSLPAVPRYAPRTVTFLVEPFTRTAISARDVRTIWPNELEAFEQDDDVRTIEMHQEEAPFSLSEHYRLAANGLAFVSQDEEIDRIDFNASNFDSQFALFTVSGNRVLRLPEQTPEPMKQAIVEASKRPRGERLVTETLVSVATEDRTVRTEPVSSEDILMTGKEHREAFVEALAGACHMVAIHSTFIRPSAFYELETELRAAVRRGAEVDIFWGAAAGEKDIEKNFLAALEINRKIDADPEIRSRIRVHFGSTRSHAKLLLADTGRRDQGIAIVGSCNWFYSGFNRFECSLRTRHPHVVAKVARCFSDLIYTSVRSADVVSRLHVFGRDLERQLVQQGPCSITVLLANDHNPLVREARDSAQAEILITSDRLGAAAEARAIIPLISTVRPGVARRILYSQASGLVKKTDAETLKADAKERGVELVELSKRELHAKVLLWDSDDVVISSLNWASADTHDDAPQGEIGVHINCPGVATDVAGRIFSEVRTGVIDR